MAEIEQTESAPSPRKRRARRVTKRTRRWWVWVIVAALPVLGWRTYQVYFAPFDPAAWMQAGPYQRYAMIRQLQGSHPLVGQTRSEIVALIGEPDYLPGWYLTDDGRDYVVLSPKYDAEDVCSEFEVMGFDRCPLWLILGIR